MKKAHFEQLLNSLAEARRYARGEKVPGLKTHVRTVNSAAVATTRLKAGLTQTEFAKLLGASLGTVRKWEAGERAPSGAAATLLRVLDFDPTVIQRALGATPAKAKRTPRSRLAAAE